MKRLSIILLFVLIGLVLQQAAPARAQDTCGSMTPLTLQRNDVAQVTEAVNSPNRLRATPSMDGEVIDSIPVQGLFTVLGRHRCADDIIWWNVRYLGQTGWTAQGRDGVNYIALVTTPAAQTATQTPTVTTTPVPQTATPTPRVTQTATSEATQGVRSCSLAPVSRLQVGDRVRITDVDGMESALFEFPRLNSELLDTIPAGRIVRLIGGPRCANGYKWWEIRYRGQTGWVGEGEIIDGQSIYYLEPVE